MCCKITKTCLVVILLLMVILQRMFFSYYTAIILLSLATLGVLCVLVYKNDRISASDKQTYYLTYALIGASAIAEWGGLQLDGNVMLPKWPLLAVKCADYILTPLAGGAIVSQMHLKCIWTRILNTLLILNALFQLIAVPCGWMVTIDESNHYTHGPLYNVYIILYFAVILLVILSFLTYGKSYRKQNRISLYAIMTLMVAGVGVQALLGTQFRTAYITLAICASLMFIHTTEFAQLVTDDLINDQKMQLSTDTLTGLLNRYAYANAIAESDRNGTAPADMVVFSIDINGLKAANDLLGHAVGDELICGAAYCIATVFAGKGQCFRTGGDEFIVFAKMDSAQAKAALVRLAHEAKIWKGEVIKELRLAAGYALASDYPGLSTEKLIIEADQEMYKEKDKYYEETGAKRRI